MAEAARARQKPNLLKEEREQGARIRKARYAVASIIIASLGVFAVIAVLAILNEGISKFISTLLSINLYYFAAALACVYLSDVVGFPKWDLFIHKLKLKISRAKNFIIYLSMFSMDITPGRWGRAAVAYTLNRQTNTRFGRTFPAVVADIFTDFLGFIVVAVATSFIVRKYSLISIFISILLLIPFIFILNKKPFAYLKNKIKKYKKYYKRMQGFFEIGDTYFESKTLLSKKDYLYSLIFTIPAMVFNGLGLYFVMLSFGIHISISLLPTILFVYTSALLMGMVTGVPGTLGVTDAALIGYLIAFFPSFGVTFGVASLITIFFRVASLWFPEFVSTITLLYTLRYWHTPAQNKE